MTGRRGLVMATRRIPPTGEDKRTTQDGKGKTEHCGEGEGLGTKKRERLPFPTSSLRAKRSNLRGWVCSS